MRTFNTKLVFFHSVKASFVKSLKLLVFITNLTVAKKDQLTS